MKGRPEVTLPEYLARPDLARLAVLLRNTEHGAFAFAIYNTVPVRDEVTSVLRTLVAPLPVYEFTFTSDNRNPLFYLEKIPPGERPERAIVFLYDVDRANVDGQAETTWGYLDAQRETLLTYPHDLVFWITDQGAKQAALQAPNIWSRRSGVFDFRIALQPVLAQIGA